ncbi:MAG: methyltransferase domain-containing protein [Bacteroidetes bacterium]|nr:methyltransferase domain-containing protein [Bacteroidota bacterium]
MNFPFKNLIPYWLAAKLRGIYQKLSALIHKGDAYTCPFCNHSFRKFRPGGIDLPVIYEKQIIGAGYRLNDVCPRCYSLDRDRLIYLFLSHKTNIFSGPLKVFHIAPEGCIRAMLSKLPNITYEAGMKYHQGFYYDKNTAVLDITKLEFEDNTFDVVICNHVLEHIPDDHKAISELYRVLKPGGWAILQVPISGILEKTFEDPSVTTAEEREKIYGQFDHVRIYGQDYPGRLEYSGFVVKRFNPYKDNWPLELDRFAINPLEDLFIAYK